MATPGLSAGQNILEPQISVTPGLSQAIHDREANQQGVPRGPLDRVEMGSAVPTTQRSARRQGCCYQTAHGA
ncbi:hypothetical protein N7532_011581 [Penicillium argentinense]|uniref:Uncharacterized protein n=1 Tax=Penicillium argentinense TaxID=1131581 RepID=A0A9W9EIN9_9EURO|nr:uncharacterized protein N7532_011581 [Penicillium argentinense]KAJ5082538.1 hypothetical protein N7532_011581 [Penicillium argentinense]